MTTLQIVLAVTAVVLVGAIVLYNTLQERRFRKDADRMFSHNRGDIALSRALPEPAGGDRGEVDIHLADDEDTIPAAPPALGDAEMPLLSRAQERASSPLITSLEPLEPSMFLADPPPSVGPAALKSSSAPSALESAPTVASAPKAAEQVVAKQTVAKPVVAEHVDPEADLHPPSGLDAETECIARLSFSSPALANFAPVLNGLRRIGKPIRAYGRRLDGVWEVVGPYPHSPYTQVEIGMQLADRGGALTSEQLDAFNRLLYDFAVKEGGGVSCPDKAEMLSFARELDRFCLEVDVLIGLNVIADQGLTFTSEAIHNLAGEMDFTLESDGRYHARDAQGRTLFTLASMEPHPFPADGRGQRLRGFTLLFDPPRTAGGLVVFDNMTRHGFALAARLDGLLVDDGSRPVSEESIARDRTRLTDFFARMAARGIPAGGERALRLFV